jgi:hypothetical protein
VVRQARLGGSFARGIGAASAIVVALTAGFGTAAALAATARSTRSVVLNETGHLHLTGHRGLTLNEQGLVAGTIKGTIYIHLTITATNSVRAEVNIYPSGGSITGQASASYRVAGATASFSGTMNVTRGSGRYAHAHASGLGFSGTIARLNDAVTVRLSGQLAE